MAPLRSPGCADPRLGLEINGAPYVVKLCFKEEKLPKRNVATIARAASFAAILASV